MGREMAVLAIYSTIGVRSAAEKLFRTFERERMCWLSVT